MGHIDPADSAQAIMGSVLVMCTRETPCGSVACPQCARTRRIEHGAAILEFLADYPVKELRLVTLINLADVVRAGQLHQFNPLALVARLRRQLERAGFDKRQCWMIGAVDGEWDEGWGVYQPHVHLVVWGIKEAQLEALIKSWPRDPRVRVRKRMEPIDDLPRVVAYLDKSWWPAVARKNNPCGVYPHGKRRPAKPIQQEILKFFAAKRASEFGFMFGVKSYSGRVARVCSH